MKTINLSITDEKDLEYGVRINGQLVATSKNMFMIEQFVKIILKVCDIAGVKVENKGRSK